MSAAHEVAREQRARLDRALAPIRSALLTPALVIDLDAVEQNARAMVNKLGGVLDAWRPHIKTVKQSRVLDALLDLGLRNFKCATLDELTLLLETAGRRDPAPELDVWWAYPALPPDVHALLRRLDRLELQPPHGRHRLTLLADAPDHAEELSTELSRRVETGVTLGLALDVDLGMARTGQPPEVWLAALRTGKLAGLGLPVRGIHGYDGHHRWNDRAAANRGYDALVSLVEAARASGIVERLDLVTSGTHSFGHALAYPGFEGVRHQVSPGTIVLNDLRSVDATRDLGLTQAAFVASRVVSTGSGRITLDAGSKGISPDGPPPSCAVLDFPSLSPQRASEEHLPVLLDPVDPTPTPKRGDLLWLVPSHVCTTVNLHRRALYVRGDRYVGDGPIEATGHPLWVQGGSPT